MAWPREIVERDHDIRNPMSAAKIRLLGDYLRLTDESRVLDVACGKGAPAEILADRHRCRILGIELQPEFADDARQRIAAAGLRELVEIRTGDASEFPLEPDTWDVALCLGAAFVWGTIADAAKALAPAVRSGFVAIGEPFWRQWPLPGSVQPAGYVSLDATVERLEQFGLALTGLVAASEDDWDHYRSLQWRAVEEWLAGHPDDPDAAAIEARHRSSRGGYLGARRSLLGWAVFVGRKR